MSASCCMPVRSWVRAALDAVLLDAGGGGGEGAGGLTGGGVWSNIDPEDADDVEADRTEEVARTEEVTLAEVVARTEEDDERSTRDGRPARPRETMVWLRMRRVVLTDWDDTAAVATEDEAKDDADEEGREDLDFPARWISRLMYLQCL